MTTDYLNIELRQQVEELKASAAAEPTTAANAEARARVVWQWLNAAALAGQHAPPDLPLLGWPLLGKDAHALRVVAPSVVKTGEQLIEGIEVTLQHSELQVFAIAPAERRADDAATH
jgi:hypothetical protein